MTKKETDKREKTTRKTAGDLPAKAEYIIDGHKA